MSKITAQYVDTCLPDYLQDGHNREGECLAFSPLGLSLEETVESLAGSVDTMLWDAGCPESILDTDIRDALRDALDGVDLRAVDGDGNRIDGEPEESDDDCIDEVYVYVVLRWDATKVTLRLTVDVEYLTAGTDPHDLKLMLEDIVRQAAGNGALTGGTDAEVVSWGATAEPIEPESKRRNPAVKGE